jgi:hypothetical protein
VRHLTPTVLPLANLECLSDSHPETYRRIL